MMAILPKLLKKLTDVRFSLTTNVILDPVSNLKISSMVLDKYLLITRFVNVSDYMVPRGTQSDWNRSIFMIPFNGKNCDFPKGLEQGINAIFDH